MGTLSHLDELEAEAIYIMREVAAECEKPVMLYSIGKDSSVMLHLAMKAFYPEKPPFPFMHIDTTWKFKEMIEFRDKIAKEKGIDMIVYTNEEGVKQGINPFDHGSAYTDIKNRQGILRTSARKCGSYIIHRLNRVKVFEYSQSLTGQRKISGSTSNAKTSKSYHFIMRQSVR